MASNGATIRLLRRFEDVRASVVEIADDVFAIPEGMVDTVRTRFANQPQVLYFLDRNIRADEFYLNSVGDKGWALRPADASPVTTTAMFNAMTPRLVDAGSPKTSVISAAGFTDMSLKLEAITYKESSGVPPAKHKVVGTYSKGVMEGHQRKLGPYPLGATLRVQVDARPPTETQGFASVTYNADLDIVKNNPGLVDKNSTSLKFSPPHSTVTRQDDLRKGLVVICGPALCDYAEFLPGFEWVIGDFVDVADRIQAVLNGVRAEHGSGVDFTKAEAALVAMREKKGAKIIAFRGSPDFDPLLMWPDTAMIPGLSFATLEADEEFTTPEKLEEAKADWFSGRWMLTAVDPNDSLDLVTEGLSVVKPGTVYTIKPSGDSTVNVGTGDGLTSVSIDRLPRLVAALLSAGAVIEWKENESFWFTNPSFDKTGYLAAKAAKAGDELPAGGVTQPFFVGDHIGEALCARLLAEPVVTKSEELLIIPTLSPQYFWTKYAREAPQLTPPSDADTP